MTNNIALFNAYSQLQVLIRNSTRKFIVILVFSNKIISIYPPSSESPEYAKNI